MVSAGAVGQVSMVVTAADTARSLGSGDVDVLGTPRLVALCESATLAAVAGSVPEGRTTVGVRVELEHLRPSAVGAAVEARAQLDSVDGRRLTFAVEATEGEQLIGRGTITRAIVDRETFGG